MFELLGGVVPASEASLFGVIAGNALFGVVVWFKAVLRLCGVPNATRPSPSYGTRRCSGHTRGIFAYFLRKLNSTSLFLPNPAFCINWKSAGTGVLELLDISHAQCELFERVPRSFLLEWSDRLCRKYVCLCFVPLERFSPELLDADSVAGVVILCHVIAALTSPHKLLFGSN